MKELQKYRVIRAYGPYCVGDIIQPTGMLRDELRACGRIAKVEDEPPAPEPIEDISDDEPDPLVETEQEPEVDLVHSAFLEPQPAPRGRRGRHGH